MSDGQKTETQAALAAAPVTAEGKLSVLNDLGLRFRVEPAKLLKIVRETCFAVPKGESPFTDEELFLGLSLARKYELDPFAKEVYLFRGKGGKVSPIIGLDGWVTMANRQPAYDGCELEPVENAKGELKAYRCTIYRKDRERPTVIEEELAECRRDTDPWRTMPRRMLRGKAFAQAVRMAFGLRGPDEVEPEELIPVATEEVPAEKRRRAPAAVVTAEASTEPDPLAAELVDDGQAEALDAQRAADKSAPDAEREDALKAWRQASGWLTPSQVSELLESAGLKGTDVEADVPSARLRQLAAAANRLAGTPGTRKRR